MGADQSIPEPRGRIAGIDFGTVRIGIAIADRQVGISSPLENYTRRGLDLDAKRFTKLAQEEKIVLFVVGLPIHLDGQESQKSFEAREFGKWLEEVTNVPVEFFDERFTSTQAEEILLSAKLTRKKRKERLDKLAAQIMLAAYLESSKKGQQEPGPIDD